LALGWYALEFAGPSVVIWDRFSHLDPSHRLADVGLVPVTATNTIGSDERASGIQGYVGDLEVDVDVVSMVLAEHGVRAVDCGF
jgi:hypothetical protein